MSCKHCVIHNPSATNHSILKCPDASNPLSPNHCSLKSRKSKTFVKAIPKLDFGNANPNSIVVSGLAEILTPRTP